VAVHDYGNFVFDHWKDSGSKSKDRSISINSNTQLTAVYRNTNEPSPPPTPTPTPTPQPTPQPTGQSALMVSTFDSNNKQISGYYTTLSKGSQLITTGFSPTKFVLDNGQAYTVGVQDYGNFVFDHWKDTGSKTRNRSISISSDTSIIAIYRYSNSRADSPTDS
jgi:hypothetical protein